MPFMKMRSIARLDFIDSIIGNNFTLDTILAIRSASSLGIAKTESTGPMRQLTTGVWGTLKVFKLSYRTIHKFLKVFSVTFYMLIQIMAITKAM